MDLLQQFRQAHESVTSLGEKLRAQVNIDLPYHSVAWEGGQYIIVLGYGDHTNYDEVNCLFENRNIWIRKIDKLRRETDKTKWPRWIKDYLLEQLPGRLKARQTAAFMARWSRERAESNRRWAEYNEKQRSRCENL